MRSHSANRCPAHRSVRNLITSRPKQQPACRPILLCGRRRYRPGCLPVPVRGNRSGVHLAWAPWLSKLSMSSTVIRMSRMIGFPPKTSGRAVIRLRRSWVVVIFPSVANRFAYWLGAASSMASSECFSSLPHRLFDAAPFRLWESLITRLTVRPAYEGTQLPRDVVGPLLHGSPPTVV